MRLRSSLASLAASRQPDVGCGPAHVNTPAQPGVTTAAAVSPPAAAARHRRHSESARARARLLGRAGPVAEDRRDPLLGQRGQADDAGVEHEDRDAGGRGRKTRLGLSLRDAVCVATGTIVSGTLEGDLVIVGSRRSEPRSTPRQADRAVRRLGGELKQRGIRASPAASSATTTRSRARARLRVVVGRPARLEDAAAVGALQFNENAVRVIVTPGSCGRRPDGRHARLGDGSGLIDPEPRADRRPANAAHLETHRLPGSTTAEAARIDPAGGTPSARRCRSTTRRCSSPARCGTALIANGIDVRGPAVDVDDVSDVRCTTRAAPIVTFHSAPLSTLAVRLMKISQNLYAETLLKTMSEARRRRPRPTGRARRARDPGAWGVPDGD